MAVPETAGEEVGLSVEAGGSGVIPNQVVGFANLRLEIELGGDDFFCDARGEVALFQEARALGRERARNDDNRGQVRFRVSFKKERDIDE